MFKPKPAISYKVHFVVHSFFIAEFYTYIVPASEILHNFPKSDIVKVEVAVFPVNVRVQIYFRQDKIAVSLQMCIFSRSNGSVGAPLGVTDFYLSIDKYYVRVFRVVAAYIEFCT